jgi:hypothetical protein
MISFWYCYFFTESDSEWTLVHFFSEQREGIALGAISAKLRCNSSLTSSAHSLRSLKA